MALIPINCSASMKRRIFNFLLPWSKTLVLSGIVSLAVGQAPSVMTSERREANYRIARGEWDIKTITLETVKEALPYGGSYFQNRILNSALDVKRMDLLRYLITVDGIQYEVWRRVLKMPDDTLRRELLVYELQAESGFWPSAGPWNDWRMGDLDTWAVEFLPLLKGVLPDIEVSKRTIYNRRTRIALAERYAKAAGIPYEPVPYDASEELVVVPAKPDAPPPVQNQATPPKADGSQGNAAPHPAVQDSSRKPASQPPNGAEPGNNWPLWAGLSTVLAAAAAWLLVRLRRGRQ